MDIRLEVDLQGIARVVEVDRDVIVGVVKVRAPRPTVVRTHEVKLQGVSHDREAHGASLPSLIVEPAASAGCRVLGGQADAGQRDGRGATTECDHRQPQQAQGHTASRDGPVVLSHDSFSAFCDVGVPSR